MATPRDQTSNRARAYGIIAGLLLFVFAAQLARAITVSAPQDPILTGDITTTEILDGTILNADIGAAANIDSTKLNLGNPTITATTITGAATISSSTVGLLTAGTINATTSLAVPTGNTTLRGVAYTWPAAQGSANTNLTNDGAGALTWVAATPAALVSTTTAGAPSSIGDALYIATSTSKQDIFRADTCAVNHRFGNSTNQAVISTKFLVHSGSRPESITFWLRTIGSPTDSVTVALSAGDQVTYPGIAFATSTIPSTLIGTNYTQFTMHTGTTTFAAGTFRWVTFGRTGAIDAINTHESCAATSGEPYSTLYLHNDPASNSADAAFDVVIEYGTFAGFTYPALGSFSTTSLNFIGYANTAVTAPTTTIDIVTDGKISGLRQNPGDSQYLSQYAGTTSPRASTFSYRTGITTAARQLILRPLMQNPQ